MKRTGERRHTSPRKTQCKATRGNAPAIPREKNLGQSGNSNPKPALRCIANTSTPLPQLCFTYTYTPTIVTPPWYQQGTTACSMWEPPSILLASEIRRARQTLGPLPQIPGRSRRFLIQCTGLQMCPLPL
ncbi:hypothetical protein AcV7_007864 [Taiwanofungus camphoratus]|nr:hypothetical protein AcV7_007864 [Antrodia cinnamomea]